jgi:hypothetical protein
MRRVLASRRSIVLAVASLVLAGVLIFAGIVLYRTVIAPLPDRLQATQLQFDGMPTNPNDIQTIHTWNIVNADQVQALANAIKSLPVVTPGTSLGFCFTAPSDIHTTTMVIEMTFTYQSRVVLKVSQVSFECVDEDILIGSDQQFPLMLSDSGDHRLTTEAYLQLETKVFP